MQKSDKFHLEIIAKRISQIKKFAQDGLENLLTDDKTQLAVAKAFEEIGEHSAKINAEFQAINSQVKWRELKAFRNKLAHDYWQIDFKQVWTIAQKDLPELQDQILNLLENFEE